MLRILRNVQVKDVLWARHTLSLPHGTSSSFRSHRYWAKWVPGMLNPRGCHQGRALSDDVTTRSRRQAVEPDFTNTKAIYSHRTTGELLRALLVFTIASVDYLVDHQVRILRWTRKLLGGAIFRRLMRATVYGNFVAGVSRDDVIPKVQRVQEAGAYSIITYLACERHGVSSALAASASTEIDRFMTGIEQSIDLAASLPVSHNLRPHVATKPSHLIEAEVMTDLASMIVTHEKLVNGFLESNTDTAKRKDFFEFLAAVRLTESRYTSYGLVSLPTTDTDTIEALLPSLLTNLTFNMSLARHPDTTRYFKDYTSLLTDDLDSSILLLWSRMETLCRLVLAADAAMLWDAEQTYMQPSIECLALDTMRRYNTDRPAFYTTYQCYLKRTLAIVSRDVELANREGFHLGVKQVRGAYLEEERRLAARLGTEDPVHPTYEATGSMYESVASLLLDQIQTGKRRSNINVIFATHNMESVRFVLDSVKARAIDFHWDKVSFAQIHGMRDHITFPLCQAGVPAGRLHYVGEVEDTVAVLSRRLQENRSGLPSSDLERRMLRQELRRRILQRTPH